jgi:hypothetical protein
VAKVVEGLSSNPSTTNKKRKKKSRYVKINSRKYSNNPKGQEKRNK